jgi:putative ABC transport system permease protein
MSFLSMILRNVFRRPLRSALTIVAMAIAIGAVVGLVGISQGFQESFLEVYRTAGVDMIVMRAGVQERLNSSLDENLAGAIAGVPGAKVVVPSLTDMISFEDANLYGVPLRGVPPGSPLVTTLRIVSGRSLLPSDVKTAVVGKTLAAQLHKKLGDSIRLYDQEDYKVVGIYDAKSVFDNNSLTVPLADLQELMGRAGQVTGFTVEVDHPDTEGNVERVVAAIGQLKDSKGHSLNLLALSVKNHVQSVTQIRVADAMSWVTSAIALVIGTIGVLNTMFMSVVERTREIGILRAIGWRKHRVVRMIVWESVVMSVVGAAVGSVGVILLTRFLSTFAAVSGFIQGTISWSVVGQGFLLSFVVAIVGVAYPAYRGAQIVPTEALRHE